jgi:hypothetical protein
MPSPLCVKSETRNPKQIRNPNNQNGGHMAFVSITWISIFGFVSDFEIRISDFSVPRGRPVAHAAPRPRAALERLGVREAPGPILFCPTGRGVVVGSAAIEDDLLVPRKRVLPRAELREGDRLGQVMLAEFLIAVVTADEQRLAGHDVGMRLLRSDSLGRHVVLLSAVDRDGTAPLYVTALHTPYRRLAGTTPGC